MSYGAFLTANIVGTIGRLILIRAFSSVFENLLGSVTSFIGGKCSKCGTLQFPKTDICVNPNCNAIGTQEPHHFAEMTGRIKSFTADRLTYSPDPPSCYGMIEFDEGGRVMIDFTDIDADQLQVSLPMRMMFRIKDIDSTRGFRRYYWKASPVPQS